MHFFIYHLTDRIKTLELNDSGLRNQIAELVAEKEKSEEQMDELSDQLDSRIKLLSVTRKYLSLD